MNLIHAIYERGVFRPTDPVDLSDGCSVECEYRVSDAAIQPAAEPFDRTSSNVRRVQLIRKRFAERLTESESRELQERQELAIQQLEEWDSRLQADVDLMQAAVEKVESWTRARRIITKVEVTEAQEINTRFVVTNMTGDAAEIYRGFYVKRGDVLERCIGELKNGMSLDRLSSPRFLANGQRLLCSVLAYLLWSLFREANVQTPELKTMEVTTARARLFKVGGLLTMTLAQPLIK